MSTIKDIDSGYNVREVGIWYYIKAYSLHSGFCAVQSELTQLD